MNRSSSPARRTSVPQHLFHETALADPQSAQSALSPAFILPEQFYDRAAKIKTSHGPSALMLAILSDALLSIQRQNGSQKKRDLRLAREATAWIFDEDIRWPFSCVNICATLDIDIEYLRSRVKAFQQRHAGSATPERARIIAMPAMERLAA